MKALKGGWKRARVKETSTSSITLLDKITSDSELLIFADKVTTFKPTEVVTGTGTTNTLDIFGDGSCIACYPFDGNAKDLSGKYNGNENNVTYVEGKFGLAVFTNVNHTSHVKLRGIIPIFDQSNVTFSCWVSNINGRRLDIIAGASNSNWNENRAEFATTHIGYYDRNWNYHLSYTPPSDSGWHHYCFVVSNSSITVYIDGKPMGVKEGVSRVNLASPCYGNVYCLGNNWYNIANNCGIPKLKVDQVRIFNRALTEEEIQILYNEYEKVYQTDISSLNLSAKPKRIYIQTNPAIYISKTFNQDTSQPDWVSYQANLKEKLKEITIDTTQTTTTQLVTTNDIALNDKLILYNNNDGIKEITVTQDNLIYDVENDVVKVDISSLNLTQPPTKCFKNPTKISIAFGEDVNTNTYQPQEVEKREFNSADNTITTTFKRFYDVDKAGRQFKVKLEGYCDTEVRELKVNLWTQKTSK